MKLKNKLDYKLSYLDCRLNCEKYEQRLIFLEKQTFHKKKEFL